MYKLIVEHLGLNHKHALVVLEVEIVIYLKDRILVLLLAHINSIVQLRYIVLLLAFILHSVHVAP